MKFIYDESKAERIINHENMMLEKYSEIISSYAPLFNQYDCSLEVKLSWCEHIGDGKRKGSDSRLPFRNGYNCYVCCDVKRDGKLVRVISNDGEVEYYDLSVAWTVSDVRRYFFKLKVSLYSGMSFVEDDMKVMLRLLSDEQ